jgi:hypothetical protein
MRTLAHAIRIRTNACAPYKEDPRAHSQYASSRTLYARDGRWGNHPFEERTPALGGRVCVPLSQGAGDLTDIRGLR